MECRWGRTAKSTRTRRRRGPPMVIRICPACGKSPAIPARRLPAPGRGRGQGGGSPFGNIGNNTPDQAAPYQPWAANLVKKRMADNSKDNPDAHCLPLGIAQMNAHPFPRKIIQTPTEVLLIYRGIGHDRARGLSGRPNAARRSSGAVVERVFRRPLGGRYARRRNDRADGRRMAGRARESDHQLGEDPRSGFAA